MKTLKVILLFVLPILVLTACNKSSRTLNTLSDGKWICEEEDLYFTVSPDGRSYGIMVLAGNEIEISVYFGVNSQTIIFYRYNEPTDMSKSTLFTGDGEYYYNRLRVQLHDNFKGFFEDGTDVLTFHLE